MLANSHFLASFVEGTQAPSAARLREWFRRAAYWKAAVPSGSKGRLHGVHVALLHSRAASPRGTLLRNAIDRLGATAVSIEFNEEEVAGGRTDISVMARVLSRLYDAVDCTGIAPSIVRSIARDSGIPVFCGLGCDQHPLRGLGELWTIEQARDGAPEQRRIRFIGNPKAQPAATFVLAGGRLGFEIATDSAAAPRAGQGVRSSFTVDATDPCRWTLQKGTSLIDPAVRSDNCACLIQELLVQEIAAG